MIHYIKGDATNPIGNGEKVIIHICNNIGAWGAGFVVALSNKWPTTKSSYLNWKNPTLCMIQKLKVEQDIFVINMIAQNNIRSKNNPTPIRYDALEACLIKVVLNIPTNASIHMPRIGCGLAGGSWDKVEKIINKTIQLNQVYVYDLT